MHALLLLLPLACSSGASTPAPTPPVEAPAAPAPETPAPPSLLPDGTPIEPCGPVPAGMACIPGGAFIRGSPAPDICPQPENPSGRPNHRPESTVWLQTYYMDLNEVTYAEYMACNKSGACDWAHPAYQDFNRPTQPMVGANWYSAARFCKAQGKHLPTEAQWEGAARGPDGETYPWGNDFATCEQAVIMDGKGERSCGVKKLFGMDFKGRTFEIGSRPAARYGIHDMAGNAEEWVADWYTSDFSACGEDCSGVDPKGPCDGRDNCPGHEKKMVKGGSWFWPGECATGYNRRPHYATNKPYHHFGFRCSASADEAQALIGAR